MASKDDKNSRRNFRRALAKSRPVRKVSGPTPGYLRAAAPRKASLSPSAS